jgi:putative ABC transport system permease protein
MRLLVAWSILVHEKARGLLAISGIFVVILLMFAQLGFYDAVPKAGRLIYDAMPFDVVLTSASYEFQLSSQTFPRRRLYQAQKLNGVESVAPVYLDFGKWLNPEDRVLREIFVIGFDLAKPVFNLHDVEHQLSILALEDTALVDTDTRSILGPLTPGRKIEIAARTIRIGGTYVLGTGFAGIGVVVTNSVNFARLFPDRIQNAVNLGLIRVEAGVDPNRIARRLRALLPPDTHVFTRAELYAHENEHWMVRTSAGLIFGFGVIVAFIVGVVILYQTLATQITRYLSQYAALKGIGYSDLYLSQVVILLALLMCGVAFVPALEAADLVYRFVRNLTRLPAEMTAARASGVLMLVAAMAALSGLVALGRLRRADPADLL